MIIATTLIAALFLVQEPIPLVVGDPVTGTLLDGAAQVHSEALDAQFKKPVLAQDFRIQVQESGVFHFRVHSLDFDAYLILRDAQGEVLAENDDGPIGVHPLLAHELHAGRQYLLQACALHGARGAFTLQALRGAPATLSPADRAAAIEADLRQRLAHLESRHGPESEEVSLALNSLGGFLLRQGRHAEVRPLIERALAIATKLLGPDHPETLTLTGNLAWLVASQGDHQASLELQQRLLERRERALGPDHPQVALTLNAIGISLASLHRYEEAIDSYERAIAIRLKVHGEVHSETATAFNNLGISLMTLGRYPQALEALERCLNINQQLFGTDHKGTAAVMQSLGGLRMLMDDLEEARELRQGALAIYRKFYPPDHPAVIGAMHGLTVVLGELGDFESARALGEEVLVLVENRNPTDQGDLANSLHNLASILMQQGNYAEAVGMFERSLAIWESILGTRDLSVASSRDNLGMLYQNLGRLEEARNMLQTSLDIRAQILGPDHPSVATSHNNLGLCLSRMGDHKKAQEQMERALDINQAHFGQGHSQTGVFQSNLATEYCFQGSFAEALSLQHRAVATMEKAYISDHPYLSMAYSSLGAIYLDLDRAQDARPYFASSMSSALRYLDRELPTMGEADRLTLLKVTADPRSFLKSIYLSGAEGIRDGFTLYAHWKGKATRLQAASLRLAQSSDNEGTGRLRAEMRKVSKELSALLFLPLAQQAGDHQERIQELRARRLAAERALNQDLDLDSLLESPELVDIQAAIPTDTVLVDFYAGSEVYAWVLKAEGPPILVSLGLPAKLREAQEAFLNTAIPRGGVPLQASGGADSDAMPAIVKMLWQPLSEHVGTTPKILVSPDGFLCELPLGILPSPDGGFLLEKHRFSYLSDPAQVVTRAVPAGTEREGDVVAIGDVNYFRRSDLKQPAAAAAGTRSRIGDSWSSLEETRTELRSLQDIHEYILEWDSAFDRYDGTDATEERVRTVLPGHRYIHIATHGYFEPEHLPSLLQDATKRHSDAGIFEQVQAAGSLPGLLSGLVFAGVNDEPDPTRDDGYFSAEEIQHLDLSACELAVLSACETALGSQRAGEGLMSLRRAFEIAGAQAVVSSLWKVDDRATAQLMKWFYQNYWVKEMPKSDALHQAKLRMLTQNRIDYQGDARPSTWGAFVLSGHWN